jgi:retron-type reverse transcriptase
VRQAARQRKGQKFTALLHHVSIDALRDAFLALKRRAAPGVDGLTWADYEAGLEDNLLDLHGRVHRGAYKALPVRRRFIPKPDGRQRPLGAYSTPSRTPFHSDGGQHSAVMADTVTG